MSETAIQKLFIQADITVQYYRLFILFYCWSPLCDFNDFKWGAYQKISFEICTIDALFESLGQTISLLWIHVHAVWINHSCVCVCRENSEGQGRCSWSCSLRLSSVLALGPWPGAWEPPCCSAQVPVLRIQRLPQWPPLTGQIHPWPQTRRVSESPNTLCIPQSYSHSRYSSLHNALSLSVTLAPYRLSDL